MRGLSLDQVRENVGLALDAVRVSKLRSGLTILGVVIGVATVMTMATIVQGIRDQILHTIEVAGPSTFYVMKIFQNTPVNPDRLPKYIRIRPDLRAEEAQRIAQLPQIQYAALWAQIRARLDYQGNRTMALAVFGADDRYQEIQGGELVEGRWFTKAEQRSGEPVVVVDETQARRLFGHESAIGKQIQLGGRPVVVIGLYQPPANIFAPAGQSTGAILPFQFVWRSYRIDRTNALWIPVKPRPGVSVADAEDAATIALREMRKLRPAEKSTFDLISQDQILKTFMSITDVFFLVMIALASVALMVGGIGVMAIMMVSVTARTREIGVRKALGATRRDILLQFLVEAVVLCVVGGCLGIAVGVATAWQLRVSLGWETAVAPSSILLAVGFATATGLIFGVWPARRAAQLDPIEALRFE